MASLATVYALSAANDEAAAQADAPTRAAMLEAFEAATWYEHEFWARSYELEAWPF